MGSEDADSSQCQSQSVSASVPCQSASSYGLVPFVAAQQPTGTAGQVSSTAGPLMLAQSAASHTPPQNVQVQPSVAASPLPHVQVIQQPLQSPYLQQLYQQPQHMFLQPGGNLTLQPSPLQGISLQLQQGKDGKILSSPMHTVGSFGTQSLIPAGNQMATAAKACVPGQMLATSSKSTVIQGQSGFIPATTSNQTVVIGQLGVLSNPQSVMPHQGKAMSDGQKGKSYLISQPATLHPKSPILPNPNVSCAGQMIATSQLKQLPNAPHIITTQAPTMITNQAQLLGSLQALGVPPGITWATPGSLHSSALFGQNPIFIRSQQSDMFIQSPPPQTIHTVPVQSQLQQQQQVQQQQQIQQQQIQQQQVQQQQIQQQQQQIQQQQQQTPPALPPPPSTPQPQPIKAKPQPLRPGSSVATQTTVSTSSSSTNASLSKAQGKSRSRNIHFRGMSVHTAQSQTATTQTQTQPPPSQKADAANQTKPTTSEPKLASIYNKILATETSFSPLPPEPLEPPEVVPVAPPVMEQQQPIIQTLPVPDIAVVAPSPVNVIPAVTQVEEDELEEEEETQATMEMEVQTPMESLPQSLPPLPLEIVAPSSRSEVATEVDNIGIVVPMPEVVTLKEKQPQKAIVKPQVLTHIIEGFVIQEGSEPFPVTIPSYSLPAKEEVVDKSMEPFSGTQTADISVSKKKDKIPKIRSGPVELAKCEFCGKLGPKAKFKRSKRFCSTSCAKRFNAGYSSKRLAIILPEQDQKPGEEIRKHKKKGSSKKGGKSKKKKQGLKSKKSWKKSENKLYEDKEWNIHLVPDIQSEAIPEDKPETPEPQMSEMASMETEDSPIVNVASDDESPAPSESADAIEEDEEPGNISNAEYATKSPLKWTVTDVVEFIRDLPGCSDYADEFRSQEIDGQALLLLKEDHLMSLMSMKLGPALKVCAKINSMRNAVSH